jgi:hypothetical protein
LVYKHQLSDVPAVQTVEQTVTSGNSRYVTRAHEQGTPHVLKPAGYALIERMSKDGRDIVSIAKALGMHRDVFRNLRKRDPAAQEALDRGRAQLGDELTDIFLEQARKGNTVAAIYLSKARLGWRDQGPDPAAGQTNVQVNINMPPNMTDEQFAALVNAPVTKLIGGGNASD